MQQFYSNGKLLITGEYVVLDGAKAFALPTKYGQYLTVFEGKNKIISWKSYDLDKSCWFETEITFDAIVSKKKIHYSQKTESTLLEILRVADRLNPNLLANSDGFDVTTTLTFDRNWGLGTSSTVINNIAQWFKVDAFELLKNSFGGSGYDIACAQKSGPIVYHLKNGMPIINEISFCPSLTNCIYFVYLNQKQNSKAAIENYRKNNTVALDTIDKIDKITEIIIATSNFAVFSEAVKNHENEMSYLLNQPTVQQQLFPDFNGTIKSLGAWGGDFVLAISTENPRNYFKLKGFTTVLSYAEMIL